jgi:hypothetical protein
MDASPRPVSTEEIGFSLMEAVIMLAVAGMALMLIFAVATRSSQSGFRLGRNALAVADRELADDSFRALVEGLEIAPAPADPARLRLAPFEGRADGFQGSAVLARANPCAPAGPANPLQVRIQHTTTGDQVLCRSNAGQAVLADLPGKRLSLAYSEDGRSWSDHWTDRPAFSSASTTAPKRSRRLYVRLASSDGRFEVLAQAPARRPELFAEAQTVTPQ